MRNVKLSETNIAECATLATTVLRKAGVIVYPTDTLYGLGADALSDVAVAKLYAIKGRDARKPIHCIVESLESAEQYAAFDDSARVLARNFWPGALTLVLKKKAHIDTGIGKGIDTIGIRIPDNPFCLALAKKFGKPITTTSANISGIQTASDVPRILRQIGKVADQIDLIVDAGELPPSAPSTVVDVSGSEAIILREGAIPTNDFFDVLGKISPGF